MDEGGGQVNNEAECLLSAYISVGNNSLVAACRPSAWHGADHCPPVTDQRKAVCAETGTGLLVRGWQPGAHCMETVYHGEYQQSQHHMLAYRPPHRTRPGGLGGRGRGGGGDVGYGGLAEGHKPLSG